RGPRERVERERSRQADEPTPVLAGERLRLVDVLQRDHRVAAAAERDGAAARAEETDLTAERALRSRAIGVLERRGVARRGAAARDGSRAAGRRAERARWSVGVGVIRRENKGKQRERGRSARGAPRREN